MYLTKRRDGSYIPSDDESHESSKKLAIGSEVKATYDRNALFHRKIMALFTLGFMNQKKTKFLTREMYRYYITKKAGYVLRDGGMEKAESLAYSSMSADRFQKLYSDVLLVISDEIDTAPKEIQAELDGFF